MSIFQDDKDYIIGTYKRFPLVLVKGNGAEVYDDKGDRYIDLTSGIGVNSLGFCDAGWKVSARCLRRNNSQVDI